VKAEWTSARPILLWSFPIISLVLLLYIRPDFFRDPLILGALIVIEIVLLALWHYRRFYLTLTLLTFAMAGVNFSLERVALSARWLVLGVGAVAGAALWMRDKQRQSLGALHLAAFLCVPAAAVSAMESADPFTSLLKVLSLFSLFVYCATGARLGMAGRETQVMNGILLGCEITVFWTGLVYALGWGFWGNPNSLGAVTAVVLTPFVFWGFLIAEGRMDKYRKGLALLICLVLLFVSASRASILTATLVLVLMCFCLRRQRLLVEGMFLVVLALAVAAVLDPSQFEQLSKNLTTDILYKGKREQGVFGSRQSPWQETVNSLKQHPWFGTGFGTSDVGDRGGQLANASIMEGIYTREGTNREHGNSYLALAEYLGLVGMLPFSILLLLVVRMIIQACRWMRRYVDPRPYAVPLAMVLFAGLVHACFEDWLLAVGYHLSFFFWVCAFFLDDLMPARQTFRLPTGSPAHPRPAAPPMAAAVPS
jgi:O-antigen ligase